MTIPIQRMCRGGAGRDVTDLLTQTTSPNLITPTGRIGFIAKEYKVCNLVEEYKQFGLTTHSRRCHNKLV